jgi:hypothetical protein
LTVSTVGFPRVARHDSLAMEWIGVGSTGIRSMDRGVTGVDRNCYDNATLI